MNFMGMGIPEVGVILLVAFLVLGPGRSIDMDRTAGKMLGDLRRSFGDVTSAFSIDLNETAKTTGNTDQRATTQDQEQKSALEPPPGVPMRAEIPPQEEQEQKEEPAGGDPGLEHGAESEEKAESGEKG